MLNTFKIPLEQLKTQLCEISCFIDSISSSEISRSTVSYNAVVISLYGCYENYVNSLVEELVRQISDNSCNYEEIPTDMKISNIHLSSDYLNSKQRYKNFNLKDEDVINNIYSGKMTNKLLLKHGGNLSIAVLSDYLKSLGIKNVAQSIKNSDDFYRYYSELKMISIEDAKTYLNKIDIDTAFIILGDIILQRNAIAHSWKSDDKVDYAIIKEEWIKFIQVFCKCLHNIVVLFYSEWLVKHNKLYSPKKFQIYSSSVVGFFDVIPHYTDHNEPIIIKSKDKIYFGKILDVKIHKDHQASIEIEGYKLKKEKHKDYSFYFDKNFLNEHATDGESFKELPNALKVQMTTQEDTAVQIQT